MKESFLKIVRGKSVVIAPERTAPHGFANCAQYCVQLCLESKEGSVAEIWGSLVGPRNQIQGKNGDRFARREINMRTDAGTSTNGLYEIFFDMTMRKIGKKMHKSKLYFAPPEIHRVEIQVKLFLE